MCCYTTGPFTILEPQNQEIGEFYVVYERATDIEAAKLRNGLSGTDKHIYIKLSDRPNSFINFRSNQPY